ncbi:hypothetical protein CC2G_008617 [Coprinopsis cinerea AmutBmut pab1-1]|nr:hypothetical protein CC2G_008617 [Coprinopsis cinerea AmutBmut pab1-1]
MPYWIYGVDVCPQPTHLPTATFQIPVVNGPLPSTLHPPSPRRSSPRGSRRTPLEKAAETSGEDEEDRSLGTKRDNFDKKSTHFRSLTAEGRRILNEFADRYPYLSLCPVAQINEVVKRVQDAGNKDYTRKNLSTWLQGRRRRALNRKAVRDKEPTDTCASTSRSSHASTNTTKFQLPSPIETPKDSLLSGPDVVERQAVSDVPSDGSLSPDTSDVAYRAYPRAWTDETDRLARAIIEGVRDSISSSSSPFEKAPTPQTMEEFNHLWKDFQPTLDSLVQILRK